MRPFEERRAISTPVVTDHDLNVAALPALSHLARTLPIAGGFVGVSLALSEASRRRVGLSADLGARVIASPVPDLRVD